MALSVDTSRALRSPTQLIDLVHAIVNADPADEKHWLEWKTHVDLTTPTWQAKCARFILGAANRPPAAAQAVAGGCAYMVLGAEPGNLETTAMPDPSQVDAQMRPYLGSAGPLYALESVRVTGKSVVIFVVDPTAPGSRPFIARKEFTKEGKTVVRRSAVYIRRIGSTEEASPEEFDAMMAEKTTSRVSGPGWDLDVRPALQNFACVDFGGGALEEWRAAERERLYTSVEPAVARLMMESRSPDDFNREVDDYVDRVTDAVALAHMASRLAAATGCRLRVDVTNNDDHAIESLVLGATVPGCAFALARPRDLPRELEFPKRPRPLGTLTRLDYGSLALGLHRSGYVHSGVTAESVGGEALLLAFPPEPIRARTTVALPAVTLLFDGAHAGQSIECQWRADSPDHRGIMEGTMLLDLPEHVLTVERVMRGEDVE